MNFRVESLCIQKISYYLRYFDDIWYTYMSGQDNVLHARIVAPPHYPSELSPLNELYRGKLISSLIVIIPNLLYILDWQFVIAYHFILGRGLCHPF